MIRYALRRLAQTLPLALFVCALVFSLIHLIPGDPVEIMLGDGARPAEVEALRRDLGLDRPLGVQFLDYFSGLLRLDLGTSLRFRQPVARLLWQHYPATLELAVASMAAALLIALPLGALAALHRDRALDHGSRVLALLGVSV
ncbi:MAG: ABC transporter permease, partial [Acidobacteriota bacterium]|nr:ABC transporter permease [Acidobacteriota bacterium]